MRAFCNARCLTVLAMLVGAPALAVSHALLSLVPGSQSVAATGAAIRDDSRRLEELTAQARALRKQIEKAEHELASPERRDDLRRWAAQRDRVGTVETVAAALAAAGVKTKQLSTGDPVAFVSGSVAVLAAERISVRCVGDYESVCRALDQLGMLPFAVRIASARVARETDGVTLDAELQAPFLPDAELRSALFSAEEDRP